MNLRNTIAIAFSALAAGLPVIPEVALADWRERIIAEIPYRVDAIAGPLNVRSGPGADYPVTARLAAGTSGLLIEDCIVDGSWCLVSFGGYGAKGWVSMRYLVGYAD